MIDDDNVMSVVATSPSPRRAWIEIFTALNKLAPLYVALPTEGVD